MRFISSYLFFCSVLARAKMAEIRPERNWSGNGRVEDQQSQRL